MTVARFARSPGLADPWPASNDVRVRPATSADAEVCGRLIYEAYHRSALAHGFRGDFTSPAAAAALAAKLIGGPASFAVVAETGRRVVGASVLTERDEVRSVGPTVVDPALQGAGIGRRLLKAVLDRAEGAGSIRLVQDAFSMAATALHASLGFEVKAPLVLLEGLPKAGTPNGVHVRPMVEADIEACNDLYLAAHGVARDQELRDALGTSEPLVVRRQGRITGYLSAPRSWRENHGVAETAADMTALLGGAASLRSEPVSILLPSRQSEVMRWCLEAGMRAVKPMVLMARGAYRVPARAWSPSAAY